MSLKKYNISELEQLSEGTREQWLSDQCAMFEQEALNLNIDTNAFVGEFYKRLINLTRRWSLWNHKRFGRIQSRSQVRQLVVWENKNKLKLSFHGSDDVIKQFEKSCQTSRRLLQRFKRDVLQPLKDFFTIDEIRSITHTVEKSISVWGLLLKNVPLNVKHLTNRSEKLLSKNLPLRKTDHDVILRLVPVLCEIEIEVIEMTRKWFVIVMTKNQERRRDTYTITSMMENDIESEKTLSEESDEVRKEINNMKWRYSSQRVKHLSMKKHIGSLYKQIESSHKRCSRYEDELHATKRQMSEGKKELELSKRETTTILCKVEDLRKQCSLLKIQLNAEKIENDKFHRRLATSEHRVRFVERELTISTQRYQQLAQESSLRCEELQHENNKLKNGLGKKKECMLPDINAQRNLKSV